MKFLLLSLSLVLITGTKAENSGNLIGDDLECAFLNCEYDYPNIHMHKSFNESDPYIYSGSADPYTNSAITTHNINLDTQKFEIQQVNYGYKYKAYSNGVVEIAVGFFKEGDELTYDNFIDDQLHTYQVTADSNTWTNIDHTYTDTSVLKDADVIAMGIRGVSDRSTTSCPSCGSDDILFSDLYLNYDYKEIPLDLISPTSPVKTIEYEVPIQVEPVIEPEPMKVDVAVAPPPVVVQQPQKPKQTQKTQSVKKETKEVKKNVTTKQETKSKSTRVSDALQKTSFVTLSSNTNNNSVFGSSIVGFNSYTGLELVETLNLVEPKFYDEPSFYDVEINLQDTIMMKDSVNLQEGRWYGSDIKFY